MSVPTDRKTNLFIILSGFFLTNAIIAEIIGVKIFSLENLFGLNESDIELWGGVKFNFNLTAGAIIWPFVFVTTDIINEYFGKSGVKKISYITSALILYVFFVVWMATGLPPAKFWLNINELPGSQTQNIDYWFSRIFTQGLGIIVGSLTAFLVGQIVDIYVFEWIKSRTGNKLLWLRATGSTLISQLIDSFLVLYIAFYLLGGPAKWPLAMVFSVGVINYIYKTVVAICLTPLLYVAHYFIDIYLKTDEEQEKISELPDLL